MKLIKRLTALLLAAVLVTGLFPFPASAQEQEPLTFETTYINPLYADIVSEEDIPPIVTPKAQTYETVHYVTTAEDAGIVLREQMKARMEAPVVHIFANVSTNEEFSALCRDLYDVAITHTREPNEGDYILWHLSGYKASGKRYTAEGGYNIDITYSMVYHSNAEQEAAVDAAVDELLSQLNLSGRSDYEKVKAVYDYICKNVRYDNTSSGTLKHTAYAALINKTAVCQGYASLLYRLLLELGVDTRVIAGSTSGGDHGWNIVELDSLYYNADSTWDEGNTSYSWFLKSPDNFPDHNRFAEYTTAAFTSAYPMASADYVPPAQPVKVTGVTLDTTSAELNVNDTVTLTATVAPATADNKSVTWSSSDTSVAAVDANGKITALKAGNATVTVTTADGGYTAACRITVKAAQVPGGNGDTVYVAFSSDVHSKTTSKTNSSHSPYRLNNWITNVSNAVGATFEEMVFCGDNADGGGAANGNDYWSMVAPVMEVTAENAGLKTDGLFLAGNHEWENGKLGSLSSLNANSQALAAKIQNVGTVVTTDNYVLYLFGASSSSQSNTGFKTEDLTALDNYLSTAPTDRPIFIASHFPIHNFNSRSTKNADQMITTLNKYGDKLDLYFIWGHNHSQRDSNYDKFFDDDDTLLNKSINFVYCAAGAMSDSEYTGSGSVKGKGMVAKIVSGKVESLTYYGTGFTATGSYKPDYSAEPDEPDVPVTLSSIAVTKNPRKTEYLAGENFAADGMEITATYSDGSTRKVQNYEIRNGSNLTADQKYVTVSYTEGGITKETTVTISVHSHQYATVVTPPTCTEKGYTTCTCSCGDSYVTDYVNATGHSFGTWYQTQAPTETTTGLERRDCANCDHYETQEIPVLEHTHNHTAVVTAPTCTEKGYTTYTCSCGDSYVADYVNATGHNFGTWYQTQAPTETTTGLERRDCANCDHYETQEIPVLEHTHNHTAVVTAPTCTEKGYTTYTCSCGDSYVADYVNATGHNFGTWYQTQAPTETTTGLERRDCANCDHYETRTVDKLEPSNPTSGACGDNLTWNFNATTGQLTVSGSGDMYGADKLGWTAFSGDIRSVEIGGGATSVGAYAFADCTGLNAVQMPDTVMSIAYNAFENCSSLKTVDIPEKVMEISYGAFMDCTSLASVELPQNVMTISYHAFDNCTSLSEVEFPTSLASIQDEAFGSCTGLDEMHFTGNAPEIQSKAFSRVTADAYYPADNTTWTSDVRQNYGGTLTWIAEGGSVTPDNSCGENITWEFEASTGTLTISGTNAKARSNGISIMDDYARPEDTPWYQYQDQIITVVIEATVDSIGKNAFAGCSNLTTVIIEEGVSEIHSTAFFDCDALENCYFEGTEEQWDDLGAEIGETPVHTQSAKPETHVETKKTVAPTCTEQGYDLYTCSCGTTRKDNFTNPTGHKWDNGIVTREPSVSAPGIRTFTCTVCEETDTEEIPYEAPIVTGSVQRISGKDRVKTALSVAEALKDTLKVEKFDAVVIATGVNEKFADALAGSYLANVKGAPILLFNGGSGLSDLNVAFIQENLKADGTVYILGGDSAVPTTVEETLAAYTVKRLSGKTRYDTNLAILKEAGITGDEILVATGTNFADSLAASAVGLPLVLVNGKGTSLNAAQTEFLQSVAGKKVTILGGTGAVSEEMEAAIESVMGVEAERISGKTRHNTSVLIAQKYFPNADSALITYALNFPDGLAGGPLAYAMGAPLLLTQEGKESIANEYIAAEDIESGYVLGGDAAVSDATARKAFGLADDAVINKAYYTE